MIDTLYVATRRCAPTGVDTLVEELGKDTFGLVMTPNACGLCVWRDGAFDGEMALTEAFEIRAFCREWELRWIRDGRDGVATLMSEDFLSCEWAEPAEIPLAGVLKRRYLLWGMVDQHHRGTAGSGGWTTLSNGRTGPIRVPIQAAGPRIELVAHEYLARFAHGNVCVFDQRLLALVDGVDGQTTERGDG